MRVALSSEATSTTNGHQGGNIELIRIVLPIVFLSAGIGLFLFLSNARTTPAAATPSDQAPTVATLPVDVFDGGIDIELDGLVVPHREIDISAEVGGRIKFKSEVCKAGIFVTSGTLLIEIDPIDYQLEVRRLTKELEQAKVSLTELDVEVANTHQLVEIAEQDLDVQRREVKRLRDLVDDRTVTESQVDQALRAEFTAHNNLLRSQNQLRLLTARRTRFEHARDLVSTQLEKANVDLKRTKIYSPIDAVIVEEMAEQDSYVQSGTKLIAVEDNSAVEVKCNLRMRDLFWLWQQEQAESGAAPTMSIRDGYQLPQAPASIIYELAGNEFVWTGHLSRYEGIGLDEKTRTAPCRLVVGEPRSVQVRNSTGDLVAAVGPPALVRGMYVKVVIHSRPRVSLLTIPSEAVQPGNTVWIVENGKLKRQEIDVARILRDSVLIQADQAEFEAGARVIVSPLANAFVGMAVTEKDAS